MSQLRATVLSSALLMTLVASRPSCGQTEYDATYEPVRFTDSTGETFYFSGVNRLAVWKERWLFVVQARPRYLYVADTTNRTLRMVGAYGSGPGEYKDVRGISFKSDTLVVAHDGFLASLYTLPELTFVRRITPIREPFPDTQIWDSRDTFLSTDLRGEHEYAGLFARYNSAGEFLRAFGNADEAKAFRSERIMRQVINSGDVLPTPANSIIFVYSYSQRLLEFDSNGALMRDVDLEMPWNDSGTGVFRDATGGWGARDLVESAQAVPRGFLVSGKGWKKKDGAYRNIVARYDWGGKLTEIIHLPDLPVRGDTEDFIKGAVQVGDSIWVTVLGDPAIRILKVTKHHPQ